MEDAAFAGAADKERVKRGLVPRKPRSKKLWYARYRLWHEAEALFEDGEEALENLSQLSPKELPMCLKKTHDHFVKHSWFQMKGRGHGFVVAGKGPALDASLDHADFAYNGSNAEGGRVFRWYSRCLLYTSPSPRDRG